MKLTRWTAPTLLMAALITPGTLDAQAVVIDHVPPASPAAMDAQIRELAEADRFSGAVLVTQADDVVLREGYGMASREFGVPNRPETRFILGSINKMFTAVAVLQLVERGEISLDDTVAQHLQGVLSDEVAERVTVRHLLTHTSGLGDFLFTPEMEGRDRSVYRTLDDYLPLLADDTLAFEPGTEWGYSNTGYLVLGALLEAVTGEDYTDLVRARVFAPAGMTDTGSPELDRVPHNLASTYTPVSDERADGFRSDRYEQVVKGTPAGGGFSTLDDMHRFARALLDGRLLEPETVELMLSAKPELQSPRYGFGAQLLWGDWVGHTGGGPGTRDFFMFRPSTGDVIMVFGNMVGETVDVVTAARRLLDG
jgi:CubicO group peptidase (beta-lactamase class C family)